MATQQLYNQYLGSKASTTSTTITGIMFCFPSDPTGESCSTQRPLQTPWLRRSTLELASSRERTLVIHRGVTSTTLGSIGKTVEVAATRAEAPPSGTMAG